MGYSLVVFEIRRTAEFDSWLFALRDWDARLRIVSRIERFAAGNPGDVKSVGDGISELRLHCGPGYRLYFTRRGDTIVLLLAGGTKASQERDIKMAKRLARDYLE